MSRRIHRRFVIALWVLAFGFFAGIAQGGVGMSSGDLVRIYGHPTSQSVGDGSRVLRWDFGRRGMIEAYEKDGELEGVDYLSGGLGFSRGEIRTLVARHGLPSVPAPRRHEPHVRAFHVDVSGDVVARVIGKHRIEVTSKKLREIRNSRK